MPPDQDRAAPAAAEADPFENEDALSCSQADSVCESLASEASSNATSKAARPSTPSPTSSFRFNSIFFPTTAPQVPQSGVPDYLYELSKDIKQHFLDEWKHLRPNNLEQFLAKTSYFNRRTLLEELQEKYICNLSSTLLKEARYLRQQDLAFKKSFSSSSSWSMKVIIISIILTKI